MNRIKVGIIGTGYTIGIAEQHLKAYKGNEKFELTALYDVVQGRAAEWAEKKDLEGVNICSSLDEFFGYVDAVSICTPNSTHVDLVVKALEAGKHVLCEKPFAVSAEEAKRAVAAAEKRPDLIAMICFNYRGVPAVKYMKHFIDEGMMGRVYTCRMEQGGSRIADPDVKLEWRMQEALSGTGALADFGVHMLDLTDFLLAESQGKICEVGAMTNTFITERNYIGQEGKGKVTNDDCAVFFGRTEKGTLLSYVSSRIGVPRMMIEIVGEGGMMIYNADSKEIEVMFKDKEGSYKGKKLEKLDIPDEYKGLEGHKDVISEFQDCITKNRKPARDLQRGLYIQNILDLLEKSAVEKKTIKVEGE